MRRRFAIDDEHFALGSKVPPTSVMAVPLAARGRVIGALLVYPDPARGFTPQELERLQALGAEAGPALDHGHRVESQAVHHATVALTRLLHATLPLSVSTQL